MSTAHSSAVPASTSARSATSWCGAGRARSSVSLEHVYRRGPFAVAERTKAAHAFGFVERHQDLFVGLTVLTISGFVNHHVTNVRAPENAKRERVRKPSQVLQSTNVTGRIKTAVSIDQRLPMKDRQVGVFGIRARQSALGILSRPHIQHGRGKLGDHAWWLTGEELVHRRWLVRIARKRDGREILSEYSR